MENKKKKLIGIMAIVIILAVICSVGGYTVYKQNKIKERSAKVKTEITENWKKFEKEEDRNKKLEIFAEVKTDKSAYQKEKDYQEEVVTEFDNLLKKMKTFFSDDYDKAIAENTLEDIEKNTDKEKISTAKENLENILNTIESEKGILKPEKIEEKISDIQELITQYTDRMKAIEEEEAKKKAEEEARKAEEAAAQAQNNWESSSSDQNYNSGTSSSVNNNWSEEDSSSSNNGGGSSNSSGGVTLLYTERFHVNGNYGTRYFYSDGSVEIIMDSGEQIPTDDPNGDIGG